MASESHTEAAIRLTSPITANGSDSTPGALGEGRQPSISGRQWRQVGEFWFLCTGREGW